MLPESLWRELLTPNFRHIASRAVREYLSVIASHQVCGNLLCSPRKIIRGPCGALRCLVQRGCSESLTGPQQTEAREAHRIPWGRGRRKVTFKAFTQVQRIVG